MKKCKVKNPLNLHSKISHILLSRSFLMDFFPILLQLSTGHVPKKCTNEINKNDMAGLSTFQSGPKGSKRSKMVNLIFFTIWDPFGQHGPFWTISNKNWFFAPKHLWQTLLVLLGQKNHFCLEWSKRVQMGPKWPTRVKNSYVDYFGPFWTLLDYLGMLTSLQWLAIFGPKWTIFGLSWAVDPNIKKAHHQVSYVWPTCRSQKRPFWNINMVGIYEKMSKIGQNSKS